MRIGLVCPYQWDVPGGVQYHVRDLAEHGEVETLARSIASSQHDEMFTMRRWLWEWFG